MDAVDDDWEGADAKDEPLRRADVAELTQSAGVLNAGICTCAHIEFVVKTFDLFSLSDW